MEKDKVVPDAVQYSTHSTHRHTHTTRMQAGYSPPSQYKYATASFSIASTLPDFAALQTREGQNTFFKSCTQTDTDGAPSTTQAGVPSLSELLRGRHPSSSPGDDAHAVRALRVGPEVGKGSASPKRDVPGRVHHVPEYGADLVEEMEETWLLH